MATFRSLLDTGRMKFTEFFRAPSKQPASPFKKRRFVPSKAFYPMEPIEEEEECEQGRPPSPPRSVPSKRAQSAEGKCRNPCAALSLPSTGDELLQSRGL